jgi:hypothetical protein
MEEIGGLIRQYPERTLTNFSMLNEFMKLPKIPSAYNIELLI